MSEVKIERVDSLPLILNWLLKMKLDVTIDHVWSANFYWKGLSYGKLALLFVAFVIHQRTHVLSRMEKWVVDHQITLQQVTGWQIAIKDATDDRLGTLLSDLGKDENQAIQFQKQMGQQLINAYSLPTSVARYDTTSINVYHAPPKPREQPSEENKPELLNYGYSKDKRPDLLQFKIGLGTIDPSGIPLLTHTLSGNTADDGQYLPAWRQMHQTIGHKSFLYVADCKAASHQNRKMIDYEGGRYLFPLPMSGQVPEWIEQQLCNHSYQGQPITALGVVDEDNKPKILGQGFTVRRQMSGELADGNLHTWSEEWFVTQSFAHAARQQASLDQRLERIRQKISSMRPKKSESISDFQVRIQLELKKSRMDKYLTVHISHTVTQIKKYKKRGRPTADTPFDLIEELKIKTEIQVNQDEFEKAKRKAGWRVYVSNTTTDQMSLSQAIAYYRDEWLVEHGFHRYKGGSLPVLPLWLRVPERIKGLILLLFIALQALTLLEFVAARSLKKEGSTLSGTVPGNPSRKTTRPSAEKLLDSFDQLNLIAIFDSESIRGKLNERLSFLQRRILTLLELPESIYDLTFTLPPPHLPNFQTTGLVSPVPHFINHFNP